VFRIERRQPTVHLIGLTALHLDLDRRVSNCEPIAERLSYRAQDLLAAAHALLSDNDVATTSGDP